MDTHARRTRTWLARSLARTERVIQSKANLEGAFDDYNDLHK